MAILDTTFIIDVLRNHSPAVKLLSELLTNEHGLFVPAPVVMEVWTGVFLLPFPDSETRKIHSFFSTVNVIDFDARAGHRAALLDASLRRGGKRLQVVDTMISAMALERGEAVITADDDFTRVPGLRVIRY